MGAQSESKLHNRKIADLQNPLRHQRGYIMITLILAFALIAIALLAVLPQITQQIRRDREEELMHRGTAYMRAIQHYYKKFGRYPSKIEDLENTNNMRFLRKRYTDPMNFDLATGKERDFKFLHQQDIALNNGPVLPGQSSLPGQAGGGSSPSPFGGAPGGFGSQGGSASFGSQPGGASPQAPASGDSGNGANAPGSPNSPGSSSDSSSNSSSGLSGPTFGGGPILGVASLSKEKTIRVFFDKTQYKDWLFIYVPGTERAGLLTGPVNPNQPPGSAGGLIPGQTGAGIPGLGQTQGLGQGLGLGQSQGQFQGQAPGQGQGLNSNSGTSTTPPDSGQTPPQ